MISSWNVHINVRKSLTESTLRTWLEISVKKQEARYVEKHPRSEQKEQGIKMTWESGFGVENEGD